MNKTDLVELIAARADMTKGCAAKALEAVLDEVAISLGKGDPVVLGGFGAFVVRSRAPREAIHNHSTGEKVRIKAAVTVSFKAGKALKDAVKEVR